MDEMENQKGRKKVVLSFGVKCVICVVLMFVITSGYLFVDEYIDRSFDLKSIIKDDFSFAFQIDEVEKEGSDVVLEGWAFKLNIDANEDDMEVLLYDTSLEKIVYPKKIEILKRQDVDDYFSCHYNYAESGFVAKFAGKQVDLQKKDYEILIADRINRKIYQTGTFISNEKQIFVNSNKFELPNVLDSPLETIVSEGVLKVYRPDIGMYVYQYEGNLYWVTDETFEFEENGTKIEYTVYTTQNERLPKEQRKFAREDLQFFFENEEVHELSVGVYRVCTRQLPTEYSVYKVVTGGWSSEKGWSWRDEFRVRYEFYK